MGRALEVRGATMSTTKSRSEERKSIQLEAAPNGGWRILLEDGTAHRMPAPYGAYTSTADMLEALSTLLYIDLQEPPHAE